MNSSVKVSVIVPVYNSEKHLRQCLDSILDQTLKEIEVICVDDGSTDASPEILEEYRKRDSRLQVLHQENLYAGVARNNGMAQAVGEYLVFWDSDDYFDLSALEKMYGKAVSDQADVCICDGRQFYEGIQFETAGGMYLARKYLPETIPFSAKEAQDVILNIINTAPWNKMFLRSYIERIGIRFQPIRTGNDMFFIECALALADRITVVDEPLVCYRRNQATSLVGTLDKSPTAAIDAWIAIHDELKKRNAFPKKSFYNRLMVNLVYMFRNASSSFVSFREELLYLQSEGIQRLSLEEVDDSDFYDPWYAECLEHIRKDTPEDFMAYLFHFTYIKLTEGNAKRLMQQQKAKDAAAKLKSEKAEHKAATARLEKAAAEADAQITSLRKDVKQLEAFLQELNAELKKAKEAWPYKLANLFRRHRR